MKDPMGGLGADVYVYHCARKEPIELSARSWEAEEGVVILMERSFGLFGIRHDERRYLN